MPVRDEALVHLDLLKFGVAILIAIAGWLLAGENTLDWCLESGTPCPADREKSLIFLAVAGGVWLGWAFITDTLALRQTPESLIEQLNLKHAHLVISATSLFVCWWAVFDDCSLLQAWSGSVAAAYIASWLAVIVGSRLRKRPR